MSRRQDLPPEHPPAPSAAAPELQGSPIGALPVAEEPYRPSRPRELLEDARRRVRAVKNAGEDLAAATARLLRLPMEAGKLMARKMFPRRA
ncbi:MAG: hypothetical protein ACOZIN_21410 [Myxococcota bacterium]